MSTTDAQDTGSVGIVIVSHVPEIALGVKKLVDQVAHDVSITYCGGTADGDIGSTFDVVLGAIEENSAHTLLAFYDLGSAKLNLELACETCTKKVLMQPVPIVEGTFAAAVLLQASAPLSEVLDELEPLKITK